MLTAIPVINAQPQFSDDEMMMLKERKVSPNILKYHTSQENFPMSAPKFSGKSNLADGNVDQTFFASVTEANGYVNKSVVQPDGKIIVVGLFQRVNGTTANGIVRLNSDGSLDTSFNTGTGANLAIRTVALQADGKILVAGALTAFNNQPVNRIVRLNANGSIDSSFNLSTVTLGSQINDILILPDGKILVGGQFAVGTSRLIVLNTDGTLNSSISGFNNTVFAITASADGKIVVGGSFTGRIARLNSDLSRDMTLIAGTGLSVVYSLAVQPDGKIVLGGYFTTYNGITTDGLVRINSDGSLDTAFDLVSDTEAVNLEVEAIATQPDGKILVNYYYLTDNGNWLGKVVRFNSSGTPDTGFTTGNFEDEFAPGLTLMNDGKILVGGSFLSYNNQIGNQARFRFVRLNQNGTRDNTFNASVSTLGIVFAIKQLSDGKIIIAGNFEYVNGAKKRAIARLNSDGSLDNSFTIGSGFYGDIYDFKVQPDGKIVIGGLGFSGAGFPAYGAARINSDGSFDRELRLSKSAISVIYNVALQPDNKILIAGQIFPVNAPVAAVRFNPDGTVDNGFTQTSMPNGTVRSLIVQPSGKIVFGGTFSAGSPNFRAGLARLNADGTYDNSFTGGCFQTFALSGLSNGQFYAGGAFGNGCGNSNTLNFLARLSVDGVVDQSFDTSGRATETVRAIEIQPDGKVLIGGHFATYDNAQANRIARVNPNGTIDSSFNSGTGTSGSVLALELQSDGKILAGGQFVDFNGMEKFSLVRLQNSSTASRRSPFDFDGDGKTDISIFRPSGGEWWYQRSSDGQVPAVQFGSAADRIVPGDYTGDGKTDIAFFRPSTGQWFVLRSEDYSFYAFPFGTNGDVPAPGDYDGDGKTDVAVFRPSNGVWYISNSSGGVSIQQFGVNGDIPVAADYDGDGKADIGIFRPSTGGWWINRSNSGLLAVTFGDGADKPVFGDYTGDGKADIAFFRPASGQWFVLRSEDFSFYGAPFGAPGDVPVPGDYDGDGKFDFAVFRSSNSGWYLSRSTAGVISQQFGFSTDQPVPSAYVP